MIGNLSKFNNVRSGIEYVILIYIKSVGHIKNYTGLKSIILQLYVLIFKLKNRQKAKGPSIIFIDAYALNYYILS